MNYKLHHKGSHWQRRPRPIRQASVEVEMRLGQRRRRVLRAENGNLVAICDERGMRQAQK